MRLNPDADVSAFPKRAGLPHIAGTPDGSAWFWGGNDELGRLNLLTPSRIQYTTTENVKSGAVVSLSLPLNVPGPPFFGRKALQHSIRSIGKGAFDDEYSLNTQSSSQWDGFRHFADPRTGYFYNGVLSEEILGEDEDEDIKEITGDRVRKLGIDAWARKGIVGRGVLLDVYGWSRRQKQRQDGKTADGEDTVTAYDPFTNYPITVNDLRSCAKEQGISSFRTGDILLVRTGWLHRYFALPDAEKQSLAGREMLEHRYAGLEASDEMKDFLHDNYFAAAVTDSANFEAWPPPSFELSLHASLLPLWGMPIGELWDLEGLSVKCEEEGRWTFLVTSAPGNVPGGVGSPPNSLAVF